MTYRPPQPPGSPEGIVPDDNQGDALALADAVWDQVCRHIDGLAIGSTMAALAERGGLAILAGRDPVSVGRLRSSLGANAGYLRVAVRLLADQGWLTTSGESGTDDLIMAATPVGRLVMSTLGRHYAMAASFLPVALQLDDMLSGSADGAVSAALAEFGEIMRREWLLPRALPQTVRHQVLSHLNGHVIGPLMATLADRDLLHPDTDLLRACPAAPRGAATQLAELLAGQGWAIADGRVARLTPAGVIAAMCAQQYWYPVSYLPMFSRVPELLFGDAVAVWAPRPGADETHVDRALDIRFSASVFSVTCREPFLDIALPLFDQLPVDGQPTGVVDVGCGDGTLLETLYTAIRDQTARGQCLADYPLLMVGVEPSPVARRAASARLAGAGIPHLVVNGDVAAPDRLGRTLRQHGHDATAALYVSKSVLHDRDYREPAVAGPIADPPPAFFGAFAAPDGSSIPPTRMALSLAELFASWRRLAGRHGMLVIEAHSADPAIAAARLGRSIATAFDATQGYSNQYPVAPEVFSWAARTAGFRSREHREPRADAVGYTILTVDHFVVDGDSGSTGRQTQSPAR